LAGYERELAEAGSTERSGEALRVGRTEYEQRVGQLLLDNARLDLRLGRLEFAKRAVARHVRIVPDSAEGYFFQGQLLRKHAEGPDDLELAAASYEAAARLKPDDAASHRELGLLYRSLGEESAARTSLQRYVELEPAAVDRPIIEGYIDALREPSGSMQGE
jgi:regulator of sirC expression with transglutaminase-like and TPR domain